MLINKQRIKNIVNRYYQEVYDIQGTTTIKVFEENVGYGMSETKDCIVKITFKAKRMILFEETTYEQDIDEEKLSTIFSYFLSNVTILSIVLIKPSTLLKIKIVSSSIYLGLITLRG